MERGPDRKSNPQGRAGGPRRCRGGQRREATRDLGQWGSPGGEARTAWQGLSTQAGSAAPPPARDRTCHAAATGSWDPQH